MEYPDLDYETAQMKRRKEEAHVERSKKKPKPTQAFRAITREKHETTTRNRTEPPNPGHYHPNWNVVKPRTDNGPKYSLETTSPREQVIYLPTCLEADCSHSYPKGESLKSDSPRKDESQLDNSMNRSAFEDTLRRTQRTFRAFSVQADIHRSQWSPVPERSRLRMKSALDFHVQTKRDEFVKESDPPHAGRFSFMEPHSMVLSTNLNSVKFDFSKVVVRPDVFPVKPSAPYYDCNKEATKPRLSRYVLAFEKRPERLANVHFHALSTPKSPDLSVLERSLKMTMKSPHKHPKMGTVVPRDDIMYRTTELYLSNVPGKQLATDPPQFGGSPKKSYRSYRE
jgi:hypothetical protein